MSKQSPKTPTCVVLFLYVTKCIAKATNSCRTVRPLTLKAGH